MQSQTLPKSLHTVTVLVAVARVLTVMHPNLSRRSIVSEAAARLGYDSHPTADTHGLCARALAAWCKADGVSEYAPASVATADGAIARANAARLHDAVSRAFTGVF